MALILAIVAAIMCGVHLLSSKTLTNIATQAANEMLDADVQIGRVNLSLQRHGMVLYLDVDSVTVISKVFDKLPPDRRELLPRWADTLITFNHFGGGVHLNDLLRGKIALHHVVMDHPAINVATLNDSLSNYYIYAGAAPTEPADTSAIDLPGLSIDLLSITNPRPIRYFNAYTDTHFDLQLSDITLRGDNNPMYALHMGGDISSPMLGGYNGGSLNFGINGHMGWNADQPTRLELSNFSLRADIIDALISAHVEFGRDIIVDRYSMALQPVGVEQLLDMVPDSLRRAWDIAPGRLTTDCALEASLHSTAPFNLTVDSIPWADVRVELTPGYLKYDRIDLRELNLVASASLRGNELDSARFAIDRLALSGPATDLTLTASAGDIMSDAVFVATAKGRCTLDRLPRLLLQKLGGALGGVLTADLNVNGRQSMLSEAGIHRLQMHGNLTLRDLYYLSADTANLVTAKTATLNFGDRRNEHNSEYFAAKLTLDSLDVLHTQYSVKAREFSFAAGVQKTASTADSTIVLPMGGTLSCGMLRLVVLGDSINVNLRDINGLASITRHRSKLRQPKIDLNVDIARLSAGTPDARFLLSKAHLTTTAFKLDYKEKSKRAGRLLDSLRTAYPQLPPDSIYARALYIARHKPKGKYPRVHGQITPDSTEIIDWGTSDFLRKLLLGWQLGGDLTARRASLYTPYFPLRNRLNNFNLHFTNDTILLENLKYKAGSSDFVLSGRVSNLKRGLTSSKFRSPLRVNFELSSDTIDLNQLADATFRGSAYSLARSEGHAAKFDLATLEKEEDKADETLEKDLSHIVADTLGAMAPLMVPKNVEANLTMKARNVYYADLQFKDFSGQVLASQGALNLHDLRAASDAGSIGMSALYATPDINNLSFGFGLDIDRFYIHRFIKLVPAVDSVMPLLKDFGGIIDAEIAATCHIDPNMNIDLPSLQAAIRISGDSLTFINPDTYRTLGKWLLFKDKQDNVIKHLNAELTVRDNRMQLYPFVFDIDRYKLGVQGYNDLNMNFNYHLAVLKSPLPFKFGINISGNPDKYKVRFGKSRLNEKQAAQSVAIVDTARVNLIDQIENIFKRGVAQSRFARLNIDSAPTASAIDLAADTLSAADSAALIREGLIPAPPTPPAEENAEVKNGRKGKRDRQNADAVSNRKRRKQ